MREITDHRAGSPVDAALRIVPASDPGLGGAPTKYEIQVRSFGQWARWKAGVEFHTGALAESGPVGFTNEALLAIVLDRLRCFQLGPYPCRENAIAAARVEEAILWLGRRTRERQERGVEGKLDR